MASPPVNLKPPPPAWRGRLDDIYRRLEAEVASTGVVCRRRGICCDFEKIDHVLFSSTLELTNLLERTPLEGREVQDQLCPYWVEGACTAREGRPLGCRVYYCDTAYQAAHSQNIYEKYHREIEALAREFGVDYAYVPMVAALKCHQREGRYYDPSRPLAMD